MASDPSSFWRSLLLGHGAQNSQDPYGFLLHQPPDPGPYGLGYPPGPDGDFSFPDGNEIGWGDRLLGHGITATLASAISGRPRGDLPPYLSLMGAMNDAGAGNARSFTGLPAPSFASPSLDDFSAGSDGSAALDAPSGASQPFGSSGDSANIGGPFDLFSTSPDSGTQPQASSGYRGLAALAMGLPRDGADSNNYGSANSGATAGGVNALAPYGLLGQFRPGPGQSGGSSFPGDAPPSVLFSGFRILGGAGAAPSADSPDSLLPGFQQAVDQVFGRGGEADASTNADTHPFSDTISRASGTDFTNDVAHDPVPLFQKDVFKSPEQQQAWADFNDSVRYLPKVTNFEVSTYPDIYAAEGGNRPDGTTVGGITASTLHELKDKIDGVTDKTMPKDLTPDQRAQFFRAYTDNVMRKGGGRQALDGLNDTGVARYIADSLFREGDSGGANIVRQALIDAFGKDTVPKTGLLDKNTLDIISRKIQSPDDRQSFLEKLYTNRVENQFGAEWGRNQHMYQRAFDGN